MDDKLKKYFRAGVRLVWYIEPATRSAKAFTSLRHVQEIDDDGSLEGRDVLPGFRLSLRSLFDEANREGPRGR
jgi:Uma2 family endonuclease